VSHARWQHSNPPLTPVGRRRMVSCVVDGGWTVEATAERFQVDAKTVRKWRDRFLAEGDSGLLDKSSRPYRSPNRTSRQQRSRIVRLRQQRRWGADRIGFEVGVASSTPPITDNVSPPLGTHKCRCMRVSPLVASWLKSPRGHPLDGSLL